MSNQYGISKPLENFSNKLTSQLKVLGIELAQDTQKRFYSQSEKWKPLKKATILRKKRNKGAILVEQGTLRNSIKSVVNNGVLSIGTNSDYGRVHNVGNKKLGIPVRRWLFLDNKQKEYIRKFLKRIM